MSNFTLYLGVTLETASGKSHLRNVYIQSLENFDSITETGFEVIESLTCHKDAISIAYSSGFLEINIHGKKYKGFTNGNMLYDGNSIVSFPCLNLGITLSFNI